MTGISIPFRLATSSVRCTADLRLKTRSLHAAARATRAAGSVGTRFSAALLGGELLATMSAQLRELLQYSGSTAQSSDLRSGRRQFETEGLPNAHERAWPQESLRRRAASDFAAMPVVAPQTPPQAPLGSHAQHAALLDHGPKSTTQERHRANQEVEEVLPRVALGASTRAALGARKGQEGPPGVMARQLREYWELDRRLRNARLGIDHSPETHTRSSAPGMEAHPNAMSSSRLLEGQAALVARRLKAFASSQSKETVAGRAAWAPATETPAETSSLRESSFASPAGAPPADFADRLASVLRWQATQHGIDLT
jgi:hypothetical protein